MLETTWFVLWGLLWAVYFVLDGFDFGMGTLLPFLAKNDEENASSTTLPAPTGTATKCGSSRPAA